MAPFSPPVPMPPAPVPAEYQVFPFPIEAPSFGSRSILFNPSDNTASPHGWHDTNGATGAEYTITRGNNVHAYEDANNDNNPGYSPNSATLQFNYALDLIQAPLVNQDASITNLFYLNNRIHDVLYHSGFTEVAGNFQQNNYGNGGLGNDYVKAEAFDGSGTNNANFSTPNDGSSGRMQMYLWTAPTPDRDGSFDNGIVAHEYGHGVSNRLTGGPANSSCLGNAEQGGEGWSDWLALLLTTEPGDTTGGGMLTQARGIGTYALNQATNGLGIRRYRYSVNMAINPQTYADLATSGTGPHNKGEIWCDAIWDMSCFLINDLGFNSNPTVTTSGNYIAMKLVLEGMKLQPCSPGFLDGRDAILAADAALYSNAHRCRIWEAFARRGMGFNAVQGSSNSSTDQTAGFSMPPVCLTATQPPVAAFTSNVSTVACATNVSFTDQSSQPFSWLWKFGDNTTSTLQNPVHAYNTPGTYSVKLIVTNTLGSDSIAHTITVTAPYSATVTATPSAVCSGSTVQLNAAGTGSNNVTYNVAGITYAPVSGTGTTVTLADDAMSAALPVGFTFNFFGQNYTNFYICSNGFITFSSGQSTTVVYGVAIPGTSSPNNYVALAWNDLNPSVAGSSISYFNTGVAPNRKLIVKYSTWHFLGGTTYPFVVQAILSEGSNLIEIHSTTISNVSAADQAAKTTQGVENSSGTAGVAVAGRNSAHFSATNDAYRFSPVINYTYTWQPGNLGGATQTVTPASTGTYTVSVSDGSGCTIPFTSPVITVNANPVPVISGNSAICSGSSTTLNAGSYSSYNWSTGATTQTISVNTAGTFTVTVTSANGCTGSASKTMTVNTAPSPSISGTLSFCSGSSTTLNAGAFTTYNWSTGATTQTISVSTANTFTVTVTNASGCTGSASATTTVTTSLNPVITGSTSFCAGSSTTLNAGSFSLYNWSSGATTQTISANTAGTFTVTVTNASGCTGSTSATTTVNANPAPAISGNTSFCSGSSTTLNAGSYSLYNWSTGATTQTISANTVGTFTVTVTNASGCTGSTSATTTVNANPAPAISGSTSFCSGSSTTLNAGSFSLYNWSTGATTQTISANTAGTFTVTVTNASGCTGSTSATTIVNANPAPAISGSTSFCAGSSTTLNAGSYSLYNWSTGATTQTISANTAGTFTVTVTNASGCTGSTSATTTVNANPAPAISGSTSFCSGSSTTLNAGAFTSYNWSTGATTQTISANTAGTFTVTVTNASGCTGSTSATTIVNANPAPAISGSTSFCSGSSTTLNAGTFTSYNWSTGATTQTISVNTANTFTVTVTNSSGCTGSASAFTTVTTALNPVISGNLSFCSGSSTVLNLGSGYSNYSWSNGATTQTITINTAGSWTGTVTLNGCSGTSPSVNTTVTPAPTATISGNSTICLTQAASINLTFTGTGPWNYTVSDGSQTVSGSSSTSSATLNITPTTAGTHNYSITALSASGCSGSGSGTAVVIVSSAAPSNSFITSVTGTTGACNGDVYLMTANSATVAGTTYEWSTGGNSPIVLFSNSQTGPFAAGPFVTTGKTVWAQFGALITGTYYYVCAKAINGCGVSAVYKCLSVRGTVGIPGTITPANLIACPNDIKNYSCGVTSGATLYNWSLAGSASPITSGQGTQNVQVTFPPVFVSGQLCVTASLSCGGSSTGAPRCITITNNPALPGTMTGPAKICPGDIGIAFSVPAVTGAAGYNWTVPAGCTVASGQNTNSVTVNFPTPYSGSPSVCVTALSACGTSAARCKSVGSNVPAQPGTITGPTTNVCSSTVQYSINSVALATGYNWTAPAGTTIASGQNTPVILLNVSPVFTSGTVTVTALTSLCTPGTSAARSISISGKPNTPGAITANPTAWCNGAFVNFSTASVTPLPVYNWVVTNGTIQAGQGSNNIDVLWGTGTGGNVKVTATNGCGVSNLRSQNFAASCKEESEGLSTVINHLSVYPNPAHENITVSLYLKKAADLTLELKDITGRIVVSQNKAFIEGLNVYDMSLAQFAKGIYLLDVKSGDESTKIKVVIE
jgi:PKD repeat protein